MAHLEQTAGSDMEAWTAAVNNLTTFFAHCPVCEGYGPTVRKCGRSVTICCGAAVEGRES